MGEGGSKKFSGPPRVYFFKCNSPNRQMHRQTGPIILPRSLTREVIKVKGQQKRLGHSAWQPDKSAGLALSMSCRSSQSGYFGITVHGWKLQNNPAFPSENCLKDLPVRQYFCLSWTCRQSVISKISAFPLDNCLKFLLVHLYFYLSRTGGQSVISIPDCKTQN